MLRAIFARRRQQTLLPAILETMEPRQLLSLITGTPGDDRIIVAYGDVVGDVIIVTAPGFEDGTVLHHTRMFDIDGGDGNDYIEIQKGGYVRTKTRGGGNWVNLYGGSGNDTLVGGDNGTTFDGGAGDDQLIGRQDSGWEWMDDLRFSGAVHGVVARLDLGEVQDDGFGGHDTVSGIEGATGTPFDDVIYAGPRGDWIYGEGGNDLLSVGPTNAHFSGGDGDDTLLGGDDHDEFDPGAGNDSVVGGGGFDLLSFYGDDESTHGRIIRLDRGLVEDDGTGGVDHISGIEAVTISGSTNDVIYGDDKANQLWGGDGADFIFGGGGNDSLTGGNSSTMLGGSGNDYIGDDFHFHVIDGGRGADTIEMWGYSDSVDHIITDSDDRIIDHRESRATPDGEDRPARIDKPYVNPDGDGAAVESAQKHGKKHKGHHKRSKHARDLPMAARLFA